MLSPAIMASPDHYQTHGLPLELWDSLRPDRPVLKVEDPTYGEFWAVISYDLVRQVSRATDRFQSAPKLILREVSHERASQDLLAQGAIAKDLLELDGEPHRVRRALVTPGLSQRSLLNLRAAVEDVVESTIENAFDALVSGCDLVSMISAPVSLKVLCRLLGIPDTEMDAVRSLTNRWVAPTDAGYSGGAEAGTALRSAHSDFVEFVDELIARAARVDAQKGVIGELVRQKDLFGSAWQAEIRALILLLIVGGNETTRHAITGMFTAFSLFPQSFAALRDGGATPTGVAEEALRWSSPIIHFTRTARTDLSLGGCDLPRGALVALFYPAANHDPAAFADPDRFNPTRDGPPHVTFGGFGPHHCAGAGLARLELECVARALARRAVGIEAETVRSRIRSNFVFGVKELNVTVAAA